MSKATAYSAAGVKKEAKMALPKGVFGLDANHELLHLSYRAAQADERTAGAKTLRRGEVRGGGKKPWRQKGTGRARVGSRRNPVWRGGGVVFGPIGEANYTLDMPKKMKRIAIAQALSAQAAEDRVHVIEDFKSTDGKVKKTIELLEKMKLEGNVLLAVDEKNELVDRATRNIPNLHTVNAKYLNVRNILDADHVVISKKALDQVVVWLSGKELKPEPVKTSVKEGAK